MRDIAFARIAGWSGIASPVISLSMIFHAAAISPWFDWQRNSLSDLGVRGNTLWFNSATLIGGLLTFVLILGLAPQVRLRWIGQLGYVCALLGAVGLALVGVFPKDRGAIHFAVALTYFFATPLGYLLMGLGLLEKRRPLSGGLTVSAGLASLLLIMRTPHDGYAVPEILATLAMSGWVFAMGMALLTSWAPGAHEAASQTDTT
jgi:hypothetical membrane protein